MRLGQKSIIHFLSRVTASVLGFVATLYIARLLGSDALGTYSLAVAVVSWLGLVGNMGITAAVKKRVSEQDDPEAYAVAGLVITTVLLGVVTAGVLLFAEEVNDYVGFPAAHYIIVMVAGSLVLNQLTAILNGRHLVHVSGLLGPIRIGSRAGLQIAALAAGFGIVGLFGGYIIGHLIVVGIGAAVVGRSLERLTVPRKRHFRRILSFAKFSWLGNLRSRAFNWVDIAVLGFFVNNSFVGYYVASWNIAMFLILFGTSLSQTLFPEISRVSADGDSDSVSELVNSGLSYSGLFLIPGLVGGTFLGERILRIYGSAFTQAWPVLVVLIVAALVQGYQNQITSALNATDHPELAFRVNVVFIAANVVLNVILIYAFGWMGAAIATASSVALSLCLAYRYLSGIVKFEVPVTEIGRQSVAAGVMGAVVLLGLWLETEIAGVGHNLVVLLSLVVSGAVVYFAVLFALSTQFRATVTANLPSFLDR